jgi:hypothetical protein
MLREQVHQLLLLPKFQLHHLLLQRTSLQALQSSGLLDLTLGELIHGLIRSQDIRRLDRPEDLIDALLECAEV